MGSNKKGNSKKITTISLEKLLGGIPPMPDSVVAETNKRLKMIMTPVVRKSKKRQHKALQHAGQILLTD